MPEDAAARSLVVCCDGTWNDPGDEDDGVPAPTNVFRLFNAVDLESPEPRQLTRYQAGVGTGGPLDKLAGGAMGFGLDQDIRDCYYWLADKYRPGDRIFLFGFSRGAFTARSLAGMICKLGIVDPHGGRSLSELVRDVWDVYRSDNRDDRDPTPVLSVEGSNRVHFLGVWDTVGALGVPDDKVLLQWLDDPARYRFHDTSLSPDVAHARHAVAIDERRGSFAPTLWTQESKRAHPDVEELWFPGVHSDVGGGYRERGLSDGALMWMMVQAQGCGLRYRPGALARLAPDPEDVVHDSRQGVMKFLVTAPRPIPSLASNDEFHESVPKRRAAPLLDQVAYLPHRSFDGGPVELDVYARHPWNWTGVYLESGRAYAIAARGQWFDADIPAGPKGAGDGAFHFGKLAHRVGDVIGAVETLWKSRPGREGADFICTKRVEDADWFELIGAVADGGKPQRDGTHDWPHIFRIGASCRVRPERGGYLYCFANDAWGFYGNNRGYVTVTVEEVSPSAARTDAGESEAGTGIGTGTGTEAEPSSMPAGPGPGDEFEPEPQAGTRRSGADGDHVAVTVGHGHRDAADMKGSIALDVNGATRTLPVHPDESLALALRNRLGLTGVKVGCGLEQCGACAVLVDGASTLACARPAADFEGRRIETVEGLGTPQSPGPVQQALLDEGAAQCGYCTPGLVVAITALLRASPQPDDGAIRAALSPHLCRCGAHPRVLRAVRKLAAEASP